MRIEPGTRAIVTGASRGIGRATAIALAARGATVGLLARSKEELEGLAADLPGEHQVLAVDVGRRREVERAIERFVKWAGGIDLLVANAGIAHYGPFADVGLERAEEMIRINVIGTVYSVRAGLDPMLDASRGHIVVVSSGAGLRAFPWGAVYGGTKAFAKNFAEALRHELSGSGVSVTTVLPGEIATELHAHERDRMPDWYKADELLDPSRVAEAILSAVEADRREVAVPGIVRLLGINGVAPPLVDRILRALRGPAAAPRRD